jgi:hypothetical protein
MMDTQEQTALIKEIETLKAHLEKERYENAMLRRLLFTQYAKHPRPMNPLNLPISERAIVLFEVLPQTFDLEEVLATAEKLDVTESEAAEHIRTYFQEGMLADSEEDRRFVKTGHRPYI